MSQNKPSFKERFQSWFWWTPPISLVADTIAIWSALNTKQQYTTSQASISVTPTPERVWGMFPLSDVIWVTGLLTIFCVVSMIYGARLKSQARGDQWYTILATFASVFLVSLYFRLWLGEYWWAVVCVVPILLLFIFLTRIPRSSVPLTSRARQTSGGGGGPLPFQQPVPPEMQSLPLQTWDTLSGSVLPGIQNSPEGQPNLSSPLSYTLFTVPAPPETQSPPEGQSSAPNPLLQGLFSETMLSGLSPAEKEMGLGYLIMKDACTGETSPKVEGKPSIGKLLWNAITEEPPPEK
jgi:hypothetical protein